jgi:peptidoglycan/LPS O-acetylase OafA/YrhL
MTGGSLKLYFRPEVECLRGIAVLAVIGFHWDLQLFSGGFVGVDIFFVISGFLITRIIYTDTIAGNFSFARFYAGRIRRILPALYLLLVVVATVSWFCLLPPDYENLLNAITWVATFISNILFSQQTGYFDRPATENPLLHTWSLSVEGQFYLVFPLLIWGTVMLVQRLRFSPVRLSQALLVFALLSFLLSAYQIRTNATSAFFLAPGRAWEFLLGSFIAVDALSLSARPSVRRTATVVGIAMILIAVYAFTKTTPFPGPHALLPCVGTALVIWSYRDDKIIGQVNCLTAILIGFGTISYSLYLWHWPIFVYAKLLLGEASTLQPLAKLLLFTASVAIATLSYYIVEQPIRRRAVLRRPYSIYAAAAAASVTIVAFSASGKLTGGFPSRVGPALAAVTAYMNYDYGSVYRERTCFLDPEQEVAEYDANRCYKPSDHVTNVLIWGDSHAAHYVTGLTEVLGHDANVMQANSSSCPPIFDLDVASRPHCRSFNNRVRALVRERAPELIIMSASWSFAQDILGSEAVFFTRLQRSISEVSSYGSRAMVFGPSLQYKDRLPELIAKHPMLGFANYSAEYVRDDIFELDERMRRQFSDGAALTYISILRTICVVRACPVFATKGVPLTFDASHLTMPGSVYVVGRIMPALARRLSAVSSVRASAAKKAAGPTG